MFKIHREFKKLNIGKVNISIEKKKILNRFLKMGKKWQKTLKEMFIILSHLRRKIKTVFRFHFTPIKMPKINSTSDS